MVPGLGHGSWLPLVSNTVLVLPPITSRMPTAVPFPAELSQARSELVVALYNTKSLVASFCHLYVVSADAGAVDARTAATQKAPASRVLTGAMSFLSVGCRARVYGDRSEE